MLDPERARVCCSVGVFSQTLITYGNNTVSKEEFLRAYNKNKPATADKEKSMREYLELYTDFKLKVKAAEQLRLDTVSQIKYDMQNVIGRSLGSTELKIGFYGLKLNSHWYFNRVS